jgi:hypothetical protein
LSKLEIVTPSAPTGHKNVQPDPEGSLEEKALARLIANRRTGYDPFYK